MTSRMTATDELRRLLDERRVEWEACRVPTLRSELAATFWYDRDGNSCSAVEGADDTPDGKLSVNANLTPEQAIEATLGRGECQEVKIDRYWRGCGECGYVWEFMYGIGKCERPRYCPNCGRKVVDA